MENYILIDEHNENEGETFGVAFEDTPENRAYVEKIADRLEKREYNNECNEYDTFSIYDVTKAEIETLERFDENGYMPRVQVAKNNLGLKYLAEVATDLPYKNSCKFLSDGKEEFFDLRHGMVAALNFRFEFERVPGVTFFHNVDKTKWFAYTGCFSDPQELLYETDDVWDMREQSVILFEQKSAK